MDRVRPAMLIAALVVDVGRRLPRRCGSAVPASARLGPAECGCSVEFAGGDVVEVALPLSYISAKSCVCTAVFNGNVYTLCIRSS